ncbi:MAG: hypothetical protein V3V67_10420 [Myxococcota bacterium]
MPAAPDRNPYEPPRAPLAAAKGDPWSPLSHLEVTWYRAAPILWSLLWRAWVVGVAASFILERTVGVTLGPIAGFVASTACNVPIGIAVAKRVLQKRFRQCAIHLVPGDRPSVVAWGQSAAIWWCYYWRTTAANMALGLVTVPVTMAAVGFFPVYVEGSPLLAAPLALAFGFLHVLVTLAAFTTVLEKKYGGFEIRLVPVAW